MKSFEIIFYTRRPPARVTKDDEWLILSALDIGLRGTVVITGSEGYGHKFRMRSLQLFDPPDNPQKIIIIASEGESKLLFGHFQKEDLHLFYVKIPVEFGMLGRAD